VLFKHKEKKGQKVISEEIAFLISHILLDNNARSDVFGSNSLINIAGIAVKTGTTDEKRDNWTAGYTPSFVTVVWVGNNDNSPMHPILTSGITGAAPIWRKIMDFLLEGKPDEPPQIPEDVVEVKICAPIRSEYFLKGTEPRMICRDFPAPSPSP